jgi:hypothetical protein
VYHIKSTIKSGGKQDEGADSLRPFNLLTAISMPAQPVGRVSFADHDLGCIDLEQRTLKR